MGLQSRHVLVGALAGIVALYGAVSLFLLSSSVSTDEALATISANRDAKRCESAAIAIAKSLEPSACAEITALTANDRTLRTYSDRVWTEVVTTLETDRDPADRQRAVACVLALGRSHTWEPIARAARQDPEPKVRLAASQALLGIARRQSAAPLCDALVTEPDATVADTKAMLLLKAPGAFKAIVAEYDNPSLTPTGRKRLAHVVKKTDRTWVRPATKMLGGLRTHAVEAMLADIGKPAVKPLTKLLHSRRAEKRSAAAGALVLMEREHPRAVARLTSELKRKDLSQVARDYAYFIRLGRRSAEPTLRRALFRNGNVIMALDYMNCGNAKLEAAGEEWAGLNGYEVSWFLGPHPGPYWGKSR